MIWPFEEASVQELPLKRPVSTDQMSEGSPSFVIAPVSELDQKCGSKLK
jgi:hypothetical protein